MDNGHGLTSRQVEVWDEFESVVLPQIARIEVDLIHMRLKLRPPMSEEGLRQLRDTLRAAFIMVQLTLMPTAHGQGEGE